MLAEEVFKRFAGRVVFLTCELSGDLTKQASGVLVSDDGFIVTNAHVVEECRSISAVYVNPPLRRSFDATLKYYDKRTDTAVLKVMEKGFEHFELGPRITFEPVQPGARVYAIGNPRGLLQSISEGLVSGIRDEDGVSWIQHSASISPGSSGGALISSEGDLVGINSFLLENSQNLNVAVPAGTLMTALSAARALTGVLDFPSAQQSTNVAQVKAWYAAANGGDSLAIAKLRNAGKQGDVSAQLYLGFLYFEGVGVPRDDAESAKWSRMAAEQGNAEAQVSLATCYGRGWGVQLDQAQEVEWFRKAAEQGNAGAQEALGELYEKGEGVPTDDAEAAKWYRMAAVQGLAPAQLHLGVLYMDVKGVPKDFSEAYFWIKVFVMLWRGPLVMA
jgi:hypothetical protein